MTLAGSRSFQWLQAALGFTGHGISFLFSHCKATLDFEYFQKQLKKRQGIAEADSPVPKKLRAHKDPYMKTRVTSVATPMRKTSGAPSFLAEPAKFTQTRLEQFVSKCARAASKSFPSLSSGSSGASSSSDQ